MHRYSKAGRADLHVPPCCIYRKIYRKIDRIRRGSAELFPKFCVAAAKESELKKFVVFHSFSDGLCADNASCSGENVSARIFQIPRENFPCQKSASCAQVSGVFFADVAALVDGGGSCCGSGDLSVCSAFSFFSGDHDEGIFLGFF